MPMCAEHETCAVRWLRHLHANSYLIGLLLVSAATLAWSTAGLFTRLIPLDSWTMLVWRGIFGGSALLLVCSIKRGRFALGDYLNLSGTGWIFAFVSAIGMVFFISSLTLTTVAHVSIVYATVPLVTASLAWIFIREKVSRFALTTSLAALVGVCIMVGVAPEGRLIGDILALAMTVCLAFMMIVSRSNKRIPLLEAATVSVFLSAIMAMPFSQSANIELGQWGLLVLFGVVNSALGLTLFILGARLLPAMETALITALDAPLAPILVWLFFAEIPGISTLVGGAIVFFSVGYYLVKTQQHANQQQYSGEVSGNKNRPTN